MAHSVASAWSSSTATPRRSMSLSRRLSEVGARAVGLKATVKSDPIRRLSADALSDLKCERRVRRISEDSASTHSGGSHCRSACPSSPSEVASLPGSVLSDEDLAPQAQQPVPQVAMSSAPERQGVSRAVEFKRIARIIGQKAEFKYRTIRDAFVAADTNGDGTLSQAEAVAFFQHFGLPEETASDFFCVMDRNGSGSVDWKEFMSLCTPTFQKDDCAMPPCDYRTWRRCPSVTGQQWYFA